MLEERCFVAFLNSRSVLRRNQSERRQSDSTWDEAMRRMLLDDVNSLHAVYRRCTA